MPPPTMQTSAFSSRLNGGKVGRVAVSLHNDFIMIYLMSALTDAFKLYFPFQYCLPAGKYKCRRIFGATFLEI